MRKQKDSHNLALGMTIIILSSLLLLGYFVARSNKNLNSVNDYQQVNPNQDTTFKSENLKFSVSVPPSFTTEEKFVSVNFKNNSGEFVVDRVGTNFSNLPDYLNDLSGRNNIQIVDREEKEISGLEAIKARIIRPSDLGYVNINYFIYTNNSVYTLSTDSEELFDDLDQIAQSFRYAP